MGVIYGLGSLFFFGREGGNRATFLRVLLIGIAVGLLGYAPLLIAILALALYTWLFAMWDPTIREVAGVHLGTVVILSLVTGVAWFIRHT